MLTKMRRCCCDDDCDYEYDYDYGCCCCGVVVRGSWQQHRLTDANGVYFGYLDSYGLPALY